MSTKDYLHILDVRSSAVLTNGYVASNVIGPTSSGVYRVECLPYNHLKIIADFTQGSLTDCDIKVEFSHDGSTYSQETFWSVSGGESTESLGHHTVAADGIYEFSIEKINTRFIKISAIGNGTVTSSLLALDVVLSTR